MSDNIKVAIRMRNLIPRESESNATVFWTAKNSKSIHQINSNSSLFSFDRVFSGNEDNEFVFQDFCVPIVESVLNGFNGTIFAYGQTSSGKTYTIMGDELNPGIAQYTVSDLFDHIQSMHDREFLLRVSYMEIYNEMVNDLLSNCNENLKLQEDLYGNIKVNKLTEHIVQQPSQVLDLMKKGQRQRRTGETMMNNKSSRSHSIFRMIVESRIRGEENAVVIVSQFNLVDLAGSEKASLNAPKGARFKEGVNINKSLFTLSQVISQLSAEKEHQFVNYRDSKLTRILQNSLGGNALTAIICTVTPASLDETLSTLKFALRAKKIKNKPHVNEIQTEQALLKKYANQIKKLYEELEATKEEKDLEAKKRKDMQQQIENLKKKFVSHIAPEKTRATRRETWGGCLDAARLKMFQPSKDLLLPHEVSTEEISNHHVQFSQDKRCKRGKFNSESNLATLEEETEDFNFIEGDDTTEIDVFRSRISTLSSKHSTESTIECSKMEDAAIQTDDALSETVDENEKLRFKIESLQEQLLELQNFTTMEKQMFQEEVEEKVSESSCSKCSSISNNEGSDIAEKMNVSYSSYIDETFGPLTNLMPINNVMNPNILDLDQELLFQHINDIIEKLNQIFHIDAKLPNMCNPYLSVILQLFNLVFLSQHATNKSSAIDVPNQIQEMLHILTNIFINIGSQQRTIETQPELVSRFVNMASAIMKEIELSSAVEKEILNCTLIEDVKDMTCIDVPDVVQDSFSRSPASIKQIITQSFIAKESQTSFQESDEKLIENFVAKESQTSFQESDEKIIENFEAKESQTSFQENDLMESGCQCQMQISVLEERIADYIREIRDLQGDYDLKEKHLSLIGDKISIQEKIITSLKEELALKNQSEEIEQEENCAIKECQNLINKFTQTYYLNLNNTLDSSIEFSEPDKTHALDKSKAHLEISIRNIVSETENNAYCTAEVKSLYSNDNGNYFNDVLVNKSKNCEDCVNSNQVLEVIMKGLLEMRKFILNVLENYMDKVYLGNDFDVPSETSKVSLNSITQEIKFLRFLSERIEFYLKDKTESSEHMKNILMERTGEKYSLQNQCSVLESALKQKEERLECLCKTLSKTRCIIENKLPSTLNFATSEISEFDHENALFESLNDVIYLEKVIEMLESSIKDKEITIVSLENFKSSVVKKSQGSQTIENCPNLADIERLRKDQLKENDKLCQQVDFLKLKIKDLEKIVEDAESHEKNASEMNKLYEEKLDNASKELALLKEKETKLTDYIKDTEEKHDQESSDQEKVLLETLEQYNKRFFDRYKALEDDKDTYKAELKVKFDREVAHLKSEIEDLENRLLEEMNNNFESKSKLEDECRELKRREIVFKQSYNQLKSKFKEYTQNLKRMRIQNDKSVCDKEIQTQFDEHTKTEKNVGSCNECILLQQQVTNLQSQAKIERAMKQLESPVNDPNKKLVRDLETEKSKVNNLESNKEIMSREIKALKKDLASKYALLRSCKCRLFAKPEELTKDSDKQFDSVFKSTKAEFNDKPQETPTKDILKHNIVQKAIQAAREEEREIFHRGEGPASDMKCLLLKRKLNKKDKEIQELRALLDEKSSVSSENKPPTENKLQKNRNSAEDKRLFERQHFNERKLELGLEVMETCTPCVKPEHLPNTGSIPKIPPKKILIEKNNKQNTVQKAEPISAEEKHIQRKLKILTEDSQLPDCKTQ